MENKPQVKRRGSLTIPQDIPPTISALDSVDHTKEDQVQVNHCKIKVFNIIDHWAFTTWMTILTIYALFGDDLRLLAFTKEDDPVFYSITIACFVFFVIEITLASYSKEQYLLGFFFWLDVIATISLIPDIGWIWDPIVGNEESGTNAAQASQLARAGRASRAGTRAGRIIRIMRVIRLIRIVKLYKLTQDVKSDKNQQTIKRLIRGNVVFRGKENPISEMFETSMSVKQLEHHSMDYDASQTFEINQTSIIDTEPDDPQEQKVDYSIPEESKVGRRLSELTTRRVIILVLGMMFGLPLFSTALWMEENTSYQFGLEVLDDFIYDPIEFDFVWNHYIDYHEDLEIPLIYLEVDNLRTWETDVDADDLREVEKELVTIGDVNEDYFYQSLAIYDLRPDTKLQAGLNISRTVFICLVLAISSILFSKDANDLLLGPIEDMIQKVRKLQRNPLEAAALEEKEAFEKQQALQLNQNVEKKSKEAPLETVILEQTLIKIGALLALGFGEAGSEIIATNMSKGGGEVDPMIPGKKELCIFGFCDIRRFTDATEVLQEDVMVFVNQIAEVVHTIVDSFSGNPNKNIGDAFLLVWKFPEQVVERTKQGTRLNMAHIYVQQLADMSLISFLKIEAAISTNKKILKYKDHVKLQAELPGYSVKMGFGLHVGWAIEGAIGSEFKIDASYLSPNVNMASRLEAATKQYGVPLLISGDMYGILSKAASKNLRLIDRVTVKGSKNPVSIYTCDLDFSLLKIGTKLYDVKDKKKRKIDQRMKRDELREKAFDGQYMIYNLFEDDEELQLMRKNISIEFLERFRLAVSYYITGNWSKSRAILIEAQKIKGQEDGPTETLLQVIDEYGGRAPPDWKGFRELTEK